MHQTSRIGSHFLLLTFLFLASCTSHRSQQFALYAYRSDPSALIEFSSDFQVAGEIPIPLPLYCGLQNIFPSPAGRLFAIELSCPEGQKVLFLNVETHALTQPIVDADSHFLAWASEGKTAYLRADSLGDPYIVRVSANGVQGAVLIHGFTYDLASSPDDGKFVFTFSRGLGQGSELWLATHDANVVKPLYSDRYNYISFARFSPDGSQIAFIKIPDTQTPFTVGELWVIGADGSNPHKLADADAGHGYAANWSPDGKRIAFVARENPEDEKADQSSVALISNIYTVDVGSRALTQVTDLTNDYVETPFWSPLGNTLAFTVVINDRMEVHIADLTTEAIRSLGTESTCCPAWLRK